MVLKISELRKQYGLNPTFETEAEALAYEKERQAAYEERVAAKVKELKDLYNSDKNKYSKFKNFKENDWVEYAKICLKRDNAITTKYDFNGLPSVNNNPEIAQWAGFSYEEILQMESDGVLIPKEVLAWAHSMQDSDVTAYEINDDPNAAEETEETGTNSQSSEFKELQKKVQTLGNKSANTQVQLTQNFDTFKVLAEKAEQIKQEQESTKKDSLKQIEELTKEWEEISAKTKKGDKLTESEQKRYKELGSMLNGKDGELVTAIQASNDDLQTLIDSMDGLNNEITTGIDLGDDTIQAAKQLARYEKGYTRKNTGSKDVINITTGDIRNALQGSQGNDIAEEATTTGNGLIEFSNTLSTQLMMNQYVSLYEFAQNFTNNATETIGQTKETMGENFNIGSEDSENTEVDMPAGEGENKEEGYDIPALQAEGAGISQLINKVKENAATAQKEAEDAIKEAEETKENLIEKKAQAQEEKISQATEQQETAQEQAEGQEATQETAQPAQTAKETSGEEKSIDKEIQVETEKELTATEKLQETLKLNSERGRFNSDAEKTMQSGTIMGQTTMGLGAAFIAMGGTQVTTGSALIAAGTPMMSNIFTLAAGTAMVAIGTSMVAEGAVIITTGSMLSILGGTIFGGGIAGIVECEKADQMITQAAEDIQETIEGIEQGDEENEKSEAEKAREQMRKEGVSLLGQAISFMSKTEQEMFMSFINMIKLSSMGKDSEEIKEEAEIIEQIVTQITKTKKEEQEQLSEKKEKSEEKKQELADAMKTPDNNEGVEQAAENMKNANKDEEFTEQDQQELDKVTQEIENIGLQGQTDLFNKLQEADNLEKKAGNEQLNGNASIDFGNVTLEIGNEMLDYDPGFISYLNPALTTLLLIYKAIGASAVATGKLGQLMGEDNNKVQSSAQNKISDAKTSIQDNQMAVQGTTGIEAISLGAETEENTENTEADNTTEQTADETAENIEQSQNATEDATVVATVPPTSGATAGATTGAAAALKAVDETVAVMTDAGTSNNSSKGGSTQKDMSEMSNDQVAAEGNKVNEEGKATIKDAKETQKEGEKGEEQSNEATEEAEEASKDSEKVTKDAKKEEKDLEKESKKVVKQINKDQKEIEELTKDSEEAMQEQNTLAAEFEALNAQTEEANSRILASQQSGGGMAAGQNNGQQGGGLLTSSAGNGTETQSDITLVTANQERMTAISGRFNVLTARINDNKLSITKLFQSSNKNHRKYEKITKQRIKMQKAAQKKEKEKQAKMQKSLAVIGVVSNVLTIVQTVLTILKLVEKILFITGKVTAGLSGIPIIGQIVFVPLTTALEITDGVAKVQLSALDIVLIAGQLACGIAKAAVMFENGLSKEAWMTLGTSIASAAMSFIPAGGAAAEAAGQAAQTGTQVAQAGVQAGQAAAQAAQAGAQAAGQVAQTASMTAGQAISTGLQATSSAANLVGSTTQMISNTNTLNGKQSSKNLNTINSIAGIVSSTTGAAGGIAGGMQGSNIGQKIGQVASAVGTTVTSASQISSLIKQTQGKASGKAEAVLSLVGSSLSIAGSLTNLISGYASSGQKDENSIVDEKGNIKKGKNDKKNSDDKSNLDKVDETDSKDSQNPASNNQNPRNEVLEKLEKPENNLDEKLDEEVQRVLTADNGDIIKPETKEEIEAAASQDPQETILADEGSENEKIEKLEEPENNLNELLDEEEQRALTADNGEIIQPERGKTDAQRKFERQERMEKAMNIGSTALEVGSQGLQAYSAIKSLNEQPEQEAARNVLHLSNMKKGKSLIKKIKKRRAALYGYAVK